MDFEQSRRRFLELAGTGTALSVAGCNALPGGSEETTTDGTDAQDPNTADTSTQGPTTSVGQTAGAEKVVAVAVRPDQQQLKAQQKEIQSELQAGNITRKEAAKQYKAVQTQLRADAIASFENRLDSGTLSVEGTVDLFGILLVSGAASALIDTLGYPEVNALLPESTYQQARSQAQQTTASP